ncbi:hypothetical protein POM88_015599 [Heracleum sosnowskyi]|uniref:Uncharacterized protein n=1 Tax=Heracleum sosnowskyi TaxID=360622 RepID=A0AAD8MW25_9APIA|nr:hypothetical protein POM88_015599 [Heracleum sosnowskyi]
MATTAFVSSGLEFVPNNYAAPLNTANAPEAFHMIQKFLAQSAIGHALVEPTTLSEAEYVITSGTIRTAMGFPEFSSYTIGMGDTDLLRMMREIGYFGPLTKIGQLKRPFLRKEWSFFFDCITRTFGKKCTNWDAIPTDSLQIGYSLLYDNHFDFARLVLTNLGEKMTENRGVVYFSRFCQILFSACVQGVEIGDEDVISCFKLHKRIFSDLINKDVKKGVIGDLLLSASVQQFVNDQIHPQTQTPSQSEPQPEPLQTELPPSTSVKPKSSGRSKHVGSKPVKSVRPATEVGVSKSSVPKGRKRRLVANYLFDNLDESTPDTEAVQDEAPEVVVQESAVNDDNEDRVFVDTEAPEVIIQEATEDVEAATVPDMANADTEAEMFEQDALFADFNMDKILEAHHSISVCDTEDVATDQPTLIIEESLATHTENLSITNQIPKMGEEVDQVVEAAVEQLDEATAETLKENIVQTEEVVAESVPVEAEVLVNANSEIHEAAQINAEATADNVAEEIAEKITENVNEARVDFDNADHTSVNSDHANSGINAALSNSDDNESIPFLRDPTA